MTNETTTTALTPEITKAQITLSLSKEGLAYQNLLQEGENVTFTNDNLDIERHKLTNIQKLESKIKGLQNPHTAAWNDWNKIRKSLLDPVSELKARKEKEFNIKAQENAAAAKKIEDEKIRVKGIKDAIDTFFLEQSQAVANTSEPSEIVRIEKLIGSNKANKTRYAEFLPLLVEKADILADLIKDKKSALRELEALQEAENNATDDQAVLDILEKKEQVEVKIEQAKNDVQEKALFMACEPEVIEPEVIVAEAPKARRTTYKWEVVDMDKAKRCGYTKTVPDEEKIEEYFKSVDKKEIDEVGYHAFGIRIYKQKSY